MAASGFGWRRLFFVPRGGLPVIVNIMVAYPSGPSERSRWILAAREGIERLTVDSQRPSAWMIEQERQADGQRQDGVTVFLVNRECPWRCAMCDLWRSTTTAPIPMGDIVRQLDWVLTNVGERPLSWIKLYNAGSFFDAGAIPIEDHAAIAERCSRFDRVILECHPSLIGPRVLQFRGLLPARTKLEIAMGLETVHPEALEKLNKRITPQSFRSAAEFLRSHDCDLRTFLLVRPPFIRAEECLRWLRLSIDFALDCGSNPVVLIPTRIGNGAMEQLLALGEFSLPGLDLLEAGVQYCVELGRGRVFADLWDLERFLTPADEFGQRRARLEAINLTQQLAPDEAGIRTGTVG